MIVTSRAFVLTLVGQPELNYPVLGWDSVVTSDSVTADSEEEEYPATNLANPSTNSLWRATDDGDQYITVVVDPAVEIDYVGIARHNFGSQQIIVSIEGLIDAEWVELVEEHLFANDAPIVLRFDPQSGFDGIRVKLQPPTDAIPEAAVLYVGKLLVFELGVGAGGFTPLPYARVMNVRSGVAEAGDFLGRIVVGGRRESAVSFPHLSPEWVREEFVPFLESYDTTPFFFAWNPQEFPRETGFAWLKNDPAPVFDIHGLVAVQLEMAGVLL